MSTSNSNTNLDEFLQSLAPKTFQERTGAMLTRCIPIIPLLPKSKEPCTTHAAYDATSNPTIIAEWVRSCDPSSNCAAVARFDGYWMLDDDTGTLAQKYKEDTGQDLPETFTVQTSRGFHYYYFHNEASRLIRYGDHENSGVIDIPGYKGEARCNNQYVVGPGSVHPSGTLYEIHNGAPIVAAPVQLLEWLQKAYAISESLKPESDRPKGNGKADPGFRKLFDAVGYRPLVRRINALEDARLHVPGFKRGDTVPCPMPHHEHSDYTPCFGSIKDAPELLHCLGKCQWTGDMVAAVYKLDGDSVKYKNMYDAARAICKEEDLTFEDFFPAKPSSVSEGSNDPAEVSHAEVSGPETVRDVPIADVGIKDMPESVLDGWLGDVCKKRMLEHFPVAYAWTALVTVASALVPVDVAKNGMRCNLFGCPVGPIHSGKSEAIKHAKLLLGIQSPPLLDLMAGSAEMLTSAVEDADGRSRLYSTDELGHLLEKAQIQNSSFV